MFVPNHCQFLFQYPRTIPQFSRKYSFHDSFVFSWLVKDLLAKKIKWMTKCKTLIKVSSKHGLYERKKKKRRGYRE